MKRYIEVSLVIVLLSNCGTKSEIEKTSSLAESPTIKPREKLYIKSYKLQGSANNPRKDTAISTIDSDSFEIDLKSQPGSAGTSYLASKDLLHPSTVENLHVEYYNVVDDGGKEIVFKNPTEFLSFMSERGYQLDKKIDSKYRIGYKFKKK